MSYKQCIACGERASVNIDNLCNDCSNDEGLKMLMVEEGLTPYEYNMSFNMIKGRIAETLIEEMFLRLGYSVYRCGMENTLPGVMKYLVKDNGDIAKHIRKMPDFAIRNPKTDQLHFIEVKFRANGCFDASDLKDDYPYDDAYIIVVSKKHIKCLTAKDLKLGGVINPQTTNYLGNRKEFSEHKDVIIDFCKFATMFFYNV